MKISKRVGNLLVAILTLLAIAGCGKQDSGSTVKTTSVTFGIRLAGDNSSNVGVSAQAIATPFDCTASGIVTVEAAVYDSNYQLLASGGPWNCEDHSGIITGQNLAGPNRIIVIKANGATVIIYWGESENDLHEGQNDIGDVVVDNVDAISSAKRYRLEYVSGDNQTWAGNEIPEPMVFKIYDRVNDEYVQNGFDGLQFEMLGSSGTASRTWCWDCTIPPDNTVDPTTVFGWWAVSACPNSSSLSLNVIAKDSNSGLQIKNSPYSLQHTIQQPANCLQEPNTTITSSLPTISNSTSVIITFDSSEANSTFQCSLDGSAFLDCTSPASYNNLSDGSHTFRVAATNSLAVTDSTPATFTWTVDSVSPDTVIDSSPGLVTNSVDASFSFSSNESGGSFECSLDSAAFTSCGSPASYTALTASTHNFQVRAKDLAGNVDATPASYSWTIDTELPVISLLGSNPESITVGASYSDPGATATDNLDGDISANIQVTGSVNTASLGVYSLVYSVTDTAGNTASVTRVVTVVDSVPPVNLTLADFINNGDVQTNAGTVNLSLAASDNTAVGAYLVIDSTSATTPATPLANDPRWIGVAATTNYSAVVAHSVSSNPNNGDTIYVFVWFKDSGGLVSGVATDSINFVDSPPVSCVPADFINGGATRTNSTSVSLSICATDNVGVTAIYAVDIKSGDPIPATPIATDTGWQAVSPVQASLNKTVSYTLQNTYVADEVITIYLWMKDQSDNIVSVGSDTVIFSPALFVEDFETGWGQWYADNSIWNQGTPSVVGPSSCYSASNGCMGTTLNANYPDNASSRLISPSITLPAVTGSEEIILRFQHWVSMGSYDAAHVQIESTPGTWEDLYVYGTSTGTWTHPLLDLTKYAGTTIKLGFLLAQGNSGYPSYATAVSSGWYVDDIAITVESNRTVTVTAANGYFENFEQNWANWYAENSIWDHGLPSLVGPASCFGSSTACMATTLAANYPDNSSSRLISPKFVLPTITAAEQIQLRFQHWVSMGSYDTAHVQISVESSPLVWDAWVNIASYSTSTGTWTYPMLDLSTYAGKNVRIAFFLSQGNSGYPSYATAVSTGWYVDDVQIDVVANTAISIAAGTNNIADFESSWQDWFAENSIWDHGKPTAGPADCYSSSVACMATTLNGDYPDNSSSRLISPEINLPTITAGEQLQLRFQHWAAIGSYDTAQVQISVETTPRVWGAWQSIATYTTTSGTWAYPLLDLSAYAGSKIRVAFLLSQGNSGYPSYATGVGSGWYIDDIIINYQALAVFNLTPTNTYSVDFNVDWSNWYAENSIWELGAPSSGPVSCFGSGTCMATSLTGNYPDNASSRLTGPTIQLPAITADEDIQLRFQHWLALGSYDSAQVQVSVETSPRVWGGWQTLATYTTSSGTWTNPILDLSNFAGNKIRLGFFLAQGNSGYPSYATAVGAGWYIDDVNIHIFTPNTINVDATTPYLADFETDWQDWHAHNSIWDHGSPIVGPVECYAASAGCMATTLDANYPDNSSSRLISPKLQLPAITSDENIELRFQQWTAIGSYDSAIVQVSVETAPRTWGAWETIATYSTSTGTWAYPQLDLSTYAGKKIQLGFLLSQGNSGYPSYATAVASGWYIDDVSVEVTSGKNVVVDATTGYFVDFETGWQNWYAHNSIWDFGIPSAGPTECFAASNGCMATTLDGNYPDNSSSRLESPRITLPNITADENIELRFEHWAAIGGYDIAYVQVAVETSPRVWGAWENITSYSTTSGTWSYPLLDLSSYAGKNVKIGFFLSQSNSGYPSYATAVGSGWYIDNVSIDVTSGKTVVVDAGTSYTANFETDWQNWYAENSIWDHGVPSVGPLECYSASAGCMATTLDNNYPDTVSSRLISPAFQVPALLTGQQLQLRFQHWAAIGSWDNVQVQVSVETSPRVWGAWQTVQTYTTTSGTWAYPLLDLSAYAGGKLRLSFLLSQGNSGYPSYATAADSGWYLDDVLLQIF